MKGDIAMFGGYISKHKIRFTFELAICETCGTGGKVKGTQEKFSERPTTFMLSKQPPWLFEKVDFAGRHYDRLCGPCIERIEMLEAKRAGVREVAHQ